MWPRVLLVCSLLSVLPARTRAEAPAGNEFAVQSGFADRGFPTEVIASATAARLRTLESDLKVVAARGGRSIADGVLSIVVGGAFVTLGVVFDEPVARSMLPILGGVSIARGVVELAVMPDAEAYALEYTHMPMTTEAQLRARLIYGELALETLAQRNKIARMLDGSLTLAGGLALVPVYMLVASREYDEFRFGERIGDYFVAVGAGLSVIFGTLTLIIKSDAERRFRAYEGLLERLDAEPTSAFRSQLSVALTNNAGALVWTASF